GTSPPDALVAAVYRETEGNPFFVNEIVRLLVADGRLEQAETVREWSVTIPQSVREVVGRRLDHLSEECNRVLTIGSVIGREFGLKLLEKVSEVKGDRLLEALEEAMGARVIAELPRSIDQYWFSHALIRETLYEELSTTRRVRLHRQIGEALEELDAEPDLPAGAALGLCSLFIVGTVDQPVVDLHEEALWALGESDSAIKARVLAGLALALTFGAPREKRLALTGEALEQARRVGDDAALAFALVARLNALWELETVEERLRVSDEALRLAQAADDQRMVASCRTFRIIILLELGDISGMDAEIESLASLASELR